MKARFSSKILRMMSRSTSEGQPARFPAFRIEGTSSFLSYSPAVGDPFDSVFSRLALDPEASDPRTGVGGLRLGRAILYPWIVVNHWL